MKDASYTEGNFWRIKKILDNKESKWNFTAFNSNGIYKKKTISHFQKRTVLKILILDKLMPKS